MIRIHCPGRGALRKLKQLSSTLLWMTTCPSYRSASCSLLHYESTRWKPCNTSQARRRPLSTSRPLQAQDQSSHITAQVSNTVTKPQTTVQKAAGLTSNTITRSDTSMAPVDFKLATAGDYDELMSISHGLFNGTDYLPFIYHSWLKDHRRHMFVAKSEGKIVAFESYLLVDDGETAVMQGIRVAPWARGRGFSVQIHKFCLDTLRSNHPRVRRIRLAQSEHLTPHLVKDFRVLHTKAVVGVILQLDKLEEAMKLLEARLHRGGHPNNCTVLEPVEVFKLFDASEIVEALLPKNILVQSWLPLTPVRSNLEMLFESNIVWFYSEEHTVNCPLKCPNTPSASDKYNTRSSPSLSPSLPTSSAGFLSLGTPPYPVPWGDNTYYFDIDLFGVEVESAKHHILEQFKLCTRGLPAGGSILCFMIAEESLRTELHRWCQGLTPYRHISELIIRDMDF
ncbi:histidine N-acetyltransferase-like [Hyperolius riggenbachi]|uniref:histidine N-acetyltransferase-like n=1 Tax=Hyperolius riggenbachi TaxID=752182 RepID=UPI0035A3B946